MSISSAILLACGVLYVGVGLATIVISRRISANLRILQEGIKALREELEG